MSDTTNNDGDVQVNPSWGLLILFWAFVGVPLFWGVSQTFAKAMKLFEKPEAVMTTEEESELSTGEKTEIIVDDPAAKAAGEPADEADTEPASEGQE